MVVLEAASRVLYAPPPDGGLDPTACELHECFMVIPVVLLSERGIEIPPGERRWFFEDLDVASRAAWRWLERISTTVHVTGAHAHIRHADVLIDPRTGRPTSQLAGPAPILEPIEVGCVVDAPPAS